MGVRSSTVVGKPHEDEPETVLCLINARSKKPFILLDDMQSSTFFKAINQNGDVGNYERILFESEEVEVEITRLTQKQLKTVKRMNEEEMHEKVRIAMQSEGGDVSYSATRLTFYKSLIEPLTDNQKIIISCRDGKFVMTKLQFKTVFSNVCQSETYRVNGNYNYARTPGKAYQFFVRGAA